MARDPYDPDHRARWTSLDHRTPSGHFIITSGPSRVHHPHAAGPTHGYHAVSTHVPGGSWPAARPYTPALEPPYPFGHAYPPPMMPSVRETRGVTIIHNPGLGIMLQPPTTPPGNVLDPTVSPYIPGFGASGPTPPPSPGEDKPSPEFELCSLSPNLSEHSETSHISSHVCLPPFFNLMPTRDPFRPVPTLTNNPIAVLPHKPPRKRPPPPHRRLQSPLPSRRHAGHHPAAAVLPAQFP